MGDGWIVMIIKVDAAAPKQVLEEVLAPSV